MNAPVQPGEVLAGKYRIESVLGVGGMGVVVTATHISFDDRVAIKFLLPHAAQNAEVVARFLREGRAARKITSEHGVKVTDVGTLETGAPYMVMEYLDGYDLSHHIKSRGPLPLDEALEYFLQALEAIAEAHAQGIVHRDLKPANLFLTRRRDGSPCVKVLDFGISKIVSGSSEPDAALTRTNGMMGTALYMPPEQLQSAKDVDARADIWALGVILYELLSGNFPFMADDLPRLVMKVMLEPPAPFTEYRNDLPPAIAHILDACLQKDRNARFANVGALALALEPYAPDRAQTSIERIVRTMNIPHVPPALTRDRGAASGVSALPMHTTGGAAASAVDIAPPKKKSNAPLVAVGVIGLLVIGGGAVAVRASRNNVREDAHSATPTHEKAAPPAKPIETAAAAPEPTASTKPIETTAVVSKPVAKPLAKPTVTTATVSAKPTAAAPAKPPPPKGGGDPFEGKF